MAKAALRLCGHHGRNDEPPTRFSIQVGTNLKRQERHGSAIRLRQTVEGVRVAHQRKSVQHTRMKLGVAKGVEERLDFFPNDIGRMSAPENVALERQVRI